MIIFIILFFGASYYAPEHIEGSNPQQTATQRKWKSKELEQIPRPQNYAGFLLLIYSTSHRKHRPPHTQTTAYNSHRKHGAVLQKIFYKIVLPWTYW